MGKRGGRAPQVQPDFTQLDDDRIMSRTVWRGPDGVGHERFQVLTLRGDEIVDIQGCRSKREAERFARRRVTR